MPTIFLCFRVFKIIALVFQSVFCLSLLLSVNLVYVYLDTWILGVTSKQLRLLHGRVRDSTIVVNSLSPQMSELVLMIDTIPTNHIY